MLTIFQVFFPFSIIMVPSLDFKQPGAEQIIFPLISLIIACMDLNRAYDSFQYHHIAHSAISLLFHCIWSLFVDSALHRHPCLALISSFHLLFS